MPRTTLSLIYRVATFVFVALAAATLIPHQSATVSDLGYYTLCPFAPWSTLALLFFASLGHVLRSHLNASSS